ncbi:MAG: TIGR03619 family F420-dependent LLM class oxidoreductase [Acetobacteraceae bacterium]|nr:TIGR03619 family F420-dependent LLM class oxidoreductase [Acetobacteraceae bacterium]
MQIGFNLPISGPLSSPETLVRIAQHGEALGYDYLTLTDHIVLPNLRVPGYPYSESGEFFGEGPEHRHEQLTAAAFIAAKTSRIGLVLAVIVVPHRPAVLAAKMLSTIDVLSGGRLVVGIGAGWLQAEFDALAAPPFAERGRITDEYVAAFRSLWTEAEPRFDGGWVKFGGIRFEPKPAQKPHPPIWVGGESGPSLRRAARLGDAWYPIGSNNKHPLDSLARYRAGIDRLRRLTAEAGRDPASVALAYRVKRYGETVPDRAGDGERRLFSGKTAEIVDDFRALRELGVSAVDIDFEDPHAEESVGEMRRFQELVISRL